MISTHLSLEKLLLPSTGDLARYLVEDSGLKLLSDFLKFCDFILYSKSISIDDKKVVAKTRADLSEMPVDRLHGMLASPVFRGWYSRFGMLKNLTSEDSKFRAQMALWNNSTRSFSNLGSFSGYFGAIDGHCACWDPALVISCPGHINLYLESTGDGLAVFDATRTTILLELSDETSIVTGASKEYPAVRFLPPKAFLPDSTIPIRNDIPQLKLGFTGSLERQTAIAEEFDHTINSYNPAIDVKDFVDAGALISQLWPAEYDDFRATLRVVIPRGTPSGWRARGMTVNSYQGAIWIMARGLLPIYENLIHEQSHVKLRYIEQYLPILAEGKEGARFKVGWRSDPRPIIGIYEGVYVHMHMLMGVVLMLEAGTAMLPEEILVGRINELKTDVRNGLNILEQNAAFTHEGKSFMSWARDTIESID